MRTRVGLLLATTLGALGIGSSDPELLRAPHRGPDGFFNPWAPMERSFLRFLRWRLTPNGYDRSREPEVPVVANDGSALGHPLPRGQAALTWVGHATFAVQDGPDVFLTDPHFGDRALLPARKVPPGIPLEAVPGDAFAVVSHNHYDHLDVGTVQALPESFGWYVPLGLGDWFRQHGRTRVVELDWWQSARRGRWAITCLPSQHWSLRLDQDANASLWCTWLLDSGDHRYFFAGDTGYFHGFAEFGRRFPGIDAALLPIGAYAPRWFMRYQHMDPAEAVRAFHDLRARHFFAMHWGTFDLTDEPIDEPPRALRRVLSERNEPAGRFHVPAVGERVALPAEPPRDGAGSGP